MNTGFSFNYNGERKEFFDAGTFTLDDTLTVTAVRREFSEYNAADWVLWFENTGDKNSGIISDISDCDILLPLNIPPKKPLGYMPKITDGDACVISMNGSVPGHYYSDNDKISATEFGLNYNFFYHSKSKAFEPDGGYSSDSVMPFFDVTASGDGAVVAIGWTGGWRAEFSECENGINIKTGLKKTSFYVKPGENLRTTSILIMEYSKDEDKYNKFRKLIKNHFSHKACTKAEKEGILAFELWGGLDSETMIKRINELKSHKIRFEDIWIDAAWYGKSTNCISAFDGDWGTTTGDWFVNENSHPDGLKDVARCANEGDMNIMLWIEPERVGRESEFFKAHPEWLLDQENKDGNLLLNYGNEEAFQYAYNMISNHIETLNLSCYRQDFNMWICRYLEFNDEENRIGITEIKHITGMYRLWDLLLERFPHLVIDNCASGGRRIDIEALKRAIAFFRSDYQCEFNENPEVLQTHNAGISKYLPYNGCTSKTKSDTYAIRSSFSSSWGGAFYNAIFQDMNEDDFAWARKTVDEYRRIRKYFSCNFYNHGSEVFDDSSWAIWQYHDDETGNGIVMAFRRENSPFESVKIKLSGIPESSKLKVENLNNGEVFETSESFEITLPEKRSSVIFEYFSV